MEPLAEWEYPAELQELAAEEEAAEQKMFRDEKVPTVQQPSPTKEEAHEILEACMANSNAGWDTLFRRFSPLASWVASDSKGRFRLPRAVAEEISQETMKAVCAAIKRGTVIKNLIAYIRIIAHNKCVDYIEKKSCRELCLRVLRQEAESEHKRACAKIPLKYAGNESASTLSECLQKIGDPCATLLAQRYYEDKSYKEVAAATSVPVDQVGVQIARCLGKIKKMMEQAYPWFRTELEELLGWKRDIPYEERSPR